MRLINADALIQKMNLAIAMLKMTMKNFDIEYDPECQMELKAYKDIRDGIKDEPTIEPEQQWTPVDAALPPVDEDGYSEYILLSFANASVPCIGQYRTCEGEGYFYDGDDEKLLFVYGLRVNAWMPLPEPAKLEND